MSRTPFSEGTNPLDRKTITFVSNSIDTSAIDPYRQGVELTLGKYFQQGIAKIWSGNDGHQINVIDIGQKDDDIFADQDFFLEVAPFNPVLYLTDYFMSQVVVIDSPVNTNENGFDGIIEPLSIRRVISFTSIDAPFEAHSVKGSLETGNFDSFRNADAVVSKQRFSELSIGEQSYEDNVDMTGRVPTNLGFWPTISTKIGSFDDSQLKSGVMVPDFADSLILESLKTMSPTTDDYLPQDFFSTAASLYYDTDFISPRPSSLWFDPAIEMQLTAWWQAPYGGSPWLGQKSLATSGGRSLTGGNPPSVGTPLNGYAVADFDGTNDSLITGINAENFLSRTAWSAAALVNIRSVGVSAQPAIFVDVGVNVGIFLTSAPEGAAVHTFQYDGTNTVLASSWIPLNTWIFVQSRYDGKYAQVRVNNGPWIKNAVGPVYDLGTQLNVGSASGAFYVNGKIAELMISNTLISDTTFEQARGYVQRKYRVGV